VTSDPEAPASWIEAINVAAIAQALGIDASAVEDMTVRPSAQEPNASEVQFSVAPRSNTSGMTDESILGSILVNLSYLRIGGVAVSRRPCKLMVQVPQDFFGEPLVRIILESVGLVTLVLMSSA
jgi:hypothetical protein